MCNFLFSDSVLTLNYKYNQATSSAKTFSNSHSSSRCKPKEYPPQSDVGLGGGTRRNGDLEEICVKTICFSVGGGFAMMPGKKMIYRWADKDISTNKNDKNIFGP